MASWLGGLSSSLGCYLGPMSHSVVSFTRHISRCTKDEWVMEYKTEESNKLRRKEVETTKEFIRPKVEGLMTFYSDIDLENKQEMAAYNDLLIKGDSDIKLFIGKETFATQKLLNLQKDIQSVNVAAGFLPVVSSTSMGENIDPMASEYKHELQQKNLEVKILRERYEAMKHKLLKLQKTTKSINVAAGLLPAMPALITLGDNMDTKASEYEHQLEEQNLEMKILRGRNVAMKHKLLKLQKATECLNVAAGLLPATSSASLGENINPGASQYEYELKQKNLEVKILRGRNVVLKQKLLRLRKATQCLNVAAGLEPNMPVSTMLGDNMDHNAPEYKNQLEQQNLEMKILRGRNVAMKQKLLKLQKATECLNAAAGLLPAMSSASLGENIDPNASQNEHQLEEQNLEMKILRARNVAMKLKLLKLQKATECLNAAAGLLPAMSSASLGENIDPNASVYECELEQKNLEVKILRGRNVAIKLKLLKLQKATQYLNAAAGLLPAMSSASLGEDRGASQNEHELEQKNLEVKILRGRNVAMKHKLLRLRKATQCLNVAAGLEPAMPVSTLLSDNIDHNAPEYKNQLEQQNLEMKILRGRNVAMKLKLLKLQKATECLNAAAGLLPTISSASLSGNKDPNPSQNEHELEQKNLEVKILRGRNVAIKHKLLRLQNATQYLNAAAGLLPATSASTSLAENINHNASEYKNQLEQQNLEMKILRGRNVAMKHKLLQLHKATQCLNAAADLLPAMSSASLGENIDPNPSKYEHELEHQNLEVRILRGRNVAMKHKLLKLRKATQCLSAAAGLIPAMPVLTSLGKNIDHSASKYEHELEQRNLEVKILRGRNVILKHKLLKIRKATQGLNAAAGLKPTMPVSTSLGNNIDHNASEYKTQREQQNLKMKILRGRNVAMKHKFLKLQKAIECLNAAADLLPATSSTSLGENIDPNASQCECELEQKNVEVKILRGRNIAMKHKLLKLQKTTQCLNVAAGLEPATPASTSLGDNIDHNAPEYKNHLEQQNLEMKILRGRNVAMKHKLLKLQKAIQCLNAAVGLLPGTSLVSLGENIHPNVSEHKIELKQKTLEMKILRERHEAMKRQLLKLQNPNQSINVAAHLVAAKPASTSLGDNINPNASEYEHHLELKSIDHHASSTYQQVQNRMTRWIWSKVFPAYSEIKAACHA